MFIGLDGPLVETGEKRDRWVRRTGGGGAGEAEEAEEKEERDRRRREINISLSSPRSE